MKKWMNGLVSALFIFLLAYSSSCRTISGSRSGKDPGSFENTVLPEAGKQMGTIVLDPAARGLANGWDSEYQRKLSPCLEDDFLYRGAQASDLTFMRDFTYDQIMKETGAGIYGKASLFGLASAKVQGDMALALASTDDSTSFIYNFSLLGKSAVLRELRFNDKGSSAYNKNDLLHFKTQCGDQFVEQVKLGGQLYIGVKYNFLTKETKDKISLKVTLSLFWGLIKVSKTWSKEFRDMMKDVRISIEAYQVGGDPRKLQELKDSIYSGSCAGDEPELCAAALDRLLEYGSKDFAEQLNNLNLSAKEYQGPAIIDIVLQDYRSLKIYDPKLNSNVTVNVTAGINPQTEVRKTIDSLNRLRVNLILAENRLKILSDFKLSENDRQLIEKAQNDIRSSLSEVDVILSTSCAKAKDEPSYRSICLDKAKEIETRARAAVVPVALTPNNP